jgi:hypothetical protein
MSTDTSLITFKAISTFTNELNELFKDEQRSLKLYCHLINKTTLAHDKPIKKHVEAFRKFCVDNRDAITGKDGSKLVATKIEYSTKALIDMEQIFLLADRETISVIWSHLLTISALVDPAGKAKQILQEKTDGGTEANFLTDIISKVENHVDPDSNNPMDAISSIMKSGIFTDLVGGMGNGLQDGSLDLGKLMGTVNTMVTSLSGQAEGQEGGGDAMNMINTMMGSMMAGTNSGESNESNTPDMPDLSAMMGPMLGALAGGNGKGGMPDLSAMMGTTATPDANLNPITANIDAQVAAAKKLGTFPSESSDTTAHEGDIEKLD